jgi:hypothetical protein
MAHFAELNSSNEVLRVIVVSNDDVAANGGDLHADAETFVTSIVPYSTGGAAWKQTSYNNNFRKQYAGIGCTYDASKNKFISPQPFASWSLDSSDDWKAPVTYPSVTEIDSNFVLIVWDEDNQKWTGTADSTNYDWNASSLAWTEV